MLIWAINWDDVPFNNVTVCAVVGCPPQVHSRNLTMQCTHPQTDFFLNDTPNLLLVRDLAHHHLPQSDPNSACSVTFLVRAASRAGALFTCTYATSQVALASSTSGFSLHLPTQATTPSARVPCQLIDRAS